MHCSKQTSTSVSIALHLFHIYSKWHNYISKYIIADVIMGFTQISMRDVQFSSNHDCIFRNDLFIHEVERLSYAAKWCLMLHCTL